MRQIPAHSPQETMLKTPQFTASSLQNGETVNFCCLRQPICSTLLVAMQAD